MKSPYPEEFNRQAIGLTASLHFAPTQKAADALLKEGKDPEQIFVTGNTGIDALDPYPLSAVHPLLSESVQNADWQ